MKSKMANISETEKMSESPVKCKLMDLAMCSLVCTVFVTSSGSVDVFSVSNAARCGMSWCCNAAMLPHTAFDIRYRKSERLMC